MKELVACLIAGAFAIPLFVLFLKIHNEFEAKKARKEQLYFCQKRLHKLALHFRDDCMVATKQVVAQYTTFLTWKTHRYGPDYIVCTFLSDYRNTIDKLKEEYLKNYAIKYSEGDNGLRCEAENLPNYILDEYAAEVSEIANTFRDLSYYIADQIRELKGAE